MALVSGQWLENVDQFRLVQASGKPVLRKAYLCCLTLLVMCCYSLAYKAAKLVVFRRRQERRITDRRRRRRRSVGAGRDDGRRRRRGGGRRQRSSQVVHHQLRQLVRQRATRATRQRPEADQVHRLVHSSLLVDHPHNL